MTGSNLHYIQHYSIASLLSSTAVSKYTCVLKPPPHLLALCQIDFIVNSFQYDPDLKANIQYPVIDPTFS